MSDSPPYITLHADMMDQDMTEQHVQTFITWTHGAREFRAQCEVPIRIPAPPPPPPHFVLLPPPPPPPPPPEIFHSQFVPTIRTSPTSFPRGRSCPVTTSSNRTRQSARSAGHHQHHSRSPSSTRGSKLTRKSAGKRELQRQRQDAILTGLSPCSLPNDRPAPQGPEL